MNDFERQWIDIGSASIAVLTTAGRSGWYILGPQVRSFEQALAKNWGLPFAIGVGSGLDAIEISLRVLGCKRGDRVLTSPVSAFATTLAIARIGAVPVFVDCDAFGLVDLSLANEALKADSSIRFFVPVHLYGNTLDLVKLTMIGEEFGCAIIEDCAQSISATHRGRPTGSAGRMSATSFYPTKNLGALGDGGAILAREPGDALSAQMWRDYGQSAKYRHEVVGYNSRLDELQAALLHHVFLDRLAGWTAIRRRIAARYSAEITNEAITVMGNPEGSNSCCHLFPVLVDPARKRGFMAWLRLQNIESAEHYPIPIPEQPAMSHCDYEVLGDLSFANRICRSEVSLPVHPYLLDDEVSRVIQACNSWGG